MDEIALPRIINAAGHLSMLGGGVTPADLAAAIGHAVERALTQPVDMAALKDEASRRIALAAGAEAGCVTTGAAAGIALSVAACVAGGGLDAVHALPAASRPVVLQAGHDIDFGAPVVQMVRLGGGSPVLAGDPELVTEDHLRDALPGAAAFLYVQSHHVRPGDRVPLPRCVGLAHGSGVPVIVDAAAEEDLRVYLETGADLVIYSGGKALGALSSAGLVAGRSAFVQAVRAQERGIGRAMKVGPEQILSICITLSAYGQRSRNDDAILRQLLAALRGRIDAGISIVPDEAGRDIERLEVRTPRAVEIARSLRDGDPPIYVRGHHAPEGWFLIDPRNLDEPDASEVATRLRELLPLQR